MPNFNSSLSECFGFSQIIISEFSNVFIARELISSRFPIGVETMYKPFFITLFLFFFILLQSCAPVNNTDLEKQSKTDNAHQSDILTKIPNKKTKTNLKEKNLKKKTIIFLS